MAFCRGLMRMKELENCLIINNGAPFNKREIKKIRKHFKCFDFAPNCNLASFIPSKDYDMIFLNWGLQSLSE